MKKKRKMKKSITKIILLLIICGLVIGTAKYFAAPPIRNVV